jgi:calcineurin-like phosphoesterase family protein
MSHCPLRGVFREDVSDMRGAKEGDMWHGEHKNQAWSVENEGQFHLHGHIHSPNGGKSTKILNRQYDVGVPANAYRPVPISAIEAWIDKTKNEEKLNGKES